MEAFQVVKGFTVCPHIFRGFADASDFAAANESKLVAVMMGAATEETGDAYVMDVEAFLDSLAAFHTEVNHRRKLGTVLVAMVSKGEDKGDDEFLKERFSFVVCSYLVKRRGLEAKQAFLLLGKRTGNKCSLQDESIACLEGWKDGAYPKGKDVALPSSLLKENRDTSNAEKVVEEKEKEAGGEKEDEEDDEDEEEKDVENDEQTEDKPRAAPLSTSMKRIAAVETSSRKSFSDFDEGEMLQSKKEEDSLRKRTGTSSGGRAINSSANRGRVSVKEVVGSEGVRHQLSELEAEDSDSGSVQKNGDDFGIFSGASPRPEVEAADSPGQRASGPVANAGAAVAIPGGDEAEMGERSSDSKKNGGDNLLPGSDLDKSGEGSVPSKGSGEHAIMDRSNESTMEKSSDAVSQDSKGPDPLLNKSVDSASALNEDAKSSPLPNVGKNARREAESEGTKAGMSNSSPSIVSAKRPARSGTKGGGSTGNFLSRLGAKISTTMRKDKGQPQQQQDGRPSSPVRGPSAPVKLGQEEKDEKEGKKKREVVEITEYSDLPSSDQKLVSEAAINSGDCEANLFVLLNVLHFHTKKVYKLKEANGEVRVTAGDREEDSFDYAKAEIELLAPNDPQKMYKLLNQVGKGGFGSVHEAQPLKDRKKMYACKILPHTRAKDRKYNLEEVRFLKKCVHPNIVKFIQAFKVNTRSETQIWMIMELMRGGTLTDAVKAHNFTETQIAYVCCEMLFGIRFLHRNEIAHRDLKSANVMLTTDGQVKLIDFGLCCDMSEGEQIHMVGSPFWIPPEMIRREPHGYAADVWSFGICALELANNTIPNRQNSIYAMFSNATKGFPKPFLNPKSYSPLFKEFIQGALHLDPKERLTSKQLRDHKFCEQAASAQSMQKVITKIFTRDALDQLNLGM